MNTESYIMQEDLDVDINDLNIPDISPRESNILFFFIEITRYIQEIEKLFRIYRCNLNIMDNYCTLYNDDTIECKYDYSEDSFIVINTLVINLISSGKTLMESSENFIKFLTNYVEGYSSNFKKDYLSKTYDECFSYKFLLNLRNYSQHGHLPVSNSVENKFCFDLKQIINTPHFNIKKSIEDELVNLIEEIYSKYKGYPYIMFTRTIAEYNYCIHKLYAEFFDNIEQVFNDTLLEVERLLKQRPELIYNSKNSLNGNILIKDNSGHIHCFRYSKMKTRKMFYDFKEKAQFYLDEEKTELELLNKSIIFN